MKRLFITVLAFIIGIFALIFSLIVVIPIIIIALIADKKIEKNFIKMRANFFKQQNEYKNSKDNDQNEIIDGEYEDITKKDDARSIDRRR